jgi:hypothetical protein
VSGELAQILLHEEKEVVLTLEIMLYGNKT